MHNPLKSPERYLQWGKYNLRIASGLKEHENYFAELIQTVVPKSYRQALGEVTVTRRFFENFGGDNVRFMSRSFGVPGDHEGQTSNGMRWPYGPVAVIAPFNFPLEIPALQAFGALMVGNRVTLKSDKRVAVVMEQFIRMCIHQGSGAYLGMPASEIDLIHCANSEMETLIKKQTFRMI